MGSNTVIMVLGLVLIFGIIGNSLNKSNSESVGLTTGYYKYSVARNIAHTSINLTLRRIETFSETNFTFTGNYEGGSYKVVCDDSLGGKFLRIKSTSRYSDSTYKINALLERYAKDFPGLISTVGFNFSPIDFDLKNFNPKNPKVKISGEDHTWGWQNVNTPIPIPVPGDSTDVSAISVTTASDSSIIMNNYAAALSSTENKISVTGTIPNFANVIQEFIAMSDTQHIAGNSQLVLTSINTPAWGDSLKPKIIYIDATKSSVKINSAIGYGILIVRGKLEIASNFNFFGLIIPYNGKVDDSTGFITDTTTITQTGTMNLYGSLFMEGAAGSDFFMNGTANLYYSSSALSKAQNIGKLQFYKIVSWYE